MVVLGVLAFALVPPLAMGWQFADALYRAMVFLVVASPCALAASMMPALLSALSNGARSGVLFKGSSFVEALGKVRAIAFDKTGTLTTGHPVVCELVVATGGERDALLARTAAVERMSEHPLGAAIVMAAEKRGLRVPIATEFQARVGVGAEAVVEMTPWQVGKRELFEDVPPELAAAQAQLEDDGTTVVFAGDIRAQLAIGLRDTVRPDARAAVQALRRLGVEHFVVLTGDAEPVANACAREVGIDRVYANLMPADKVRVVEELLATHGAVAMVGDGVNDAPALATATVGIAMGSGGTDVALETADVVLMANDISRIPYAIDLGRRALRVVKQNLVVALGVIVVLVAADVLGRISLPTGVIGHEGSTLLVTLSGLRLLRRNRGGESWRVASGL